MIGSISRDALILDYADGRRIPRRPDVDRRSAAAARAGLRRNEGSKDPRADHSTARTAGVSSSASDSLRRARATRVSTVLMETPSIPAVSA